MGAVAVALRLGVWGVQVGLLPTQTVWDGPGTSLRWVGMFAAGTCPASTLSLTLFLAAFALAGARPDIWPSALSGWQNHEFVRMLTHCIQCRS